MADEARTVSSRPWSAWVGQALLYGLFAAVIGVFSQWPPYRHLAPDQALVKVSFTHAAKPAGECRRRSEAELAALPPNMRAPLVCPRGRSPIRVEVDIDGQPALRRTALPSGLSGDGAAAMYERIVVPAGEQHVVVRFNDDASKEGFTHERDARLTLAPGQVLVIDFDAHQNSIVLQ